MRCGLISGKEPSRDEIQQVWQIDRSEVIENIYNHENGRLVLKPEHFHITGWPPGEGELYTPLLLDCFDRGGWFYSLFEEAALIGVAVLESQFIGKNKDLLQLKFMHLSDAYRKHGLGHRLFELARAKAREKSAKGLSLCIGNSVREHRQFLLAPGLRPDP